MNLNIQKNYRIFCSNNPEGEINNYDDRELNDDFLLLGGSKNDVSRRKLNIIQEGFYIFDHCEF